MTYIAEGKPSHPSASAQFLAGTSSPRRRGSVRLQPTHQLSATTSCLPALSRDAQRRCARRCCGFGVKSSGEEARLSVLCNQQERAICLKRRLAAYRGRGSCARRRRSACVNSLSPCCCAAVIDIHLSLGGGVIRCSYSWLFVAKGRRGS